MTAHQNTFEQQGTLTPGLELFVSAPYLREASAGWAVSTLRIVALRNWRGQNVIVCIEDPSNLGLSPTNSLPVIRDELAANHGVPLNALWFDAPNAPGRFLFPVKFLSGTPSWGPAMSLPGLAKALGIVEADLAAAFGILGRSR